jgi:hypothetical protein
MINNNSRFLYSTIYKFKYLILFFVYAFGLFLSLKVVLGMRGPDPDTYHSIMLWYGVNEYGLSWIKDWIFTQDNWLFSLVPIHFFEFWIFGPKLSLVIVTGWIIFVASTIISGLIALELKAKKSFYTIPIVLIFMGFYAHLYGMVSYSTTHNITNLFGIFSIYILIKLIKSKNNHLITLIFLCQILSGLSDPWMIPSYTLPIALVAVILFLKSNVFQEKKQYIWLFSTMIISIVLIKTQFLGLLDFLPKMHFAIGNWEVINSNAIFLIKDLGRLFNIIPIINTNLFIFGFISFMVVMILYVISMYLVFSKDISPNKFVFFVFVFFSIGGISLAFLISDVSATDLSARFLINIPYLATIIIFVSFEKNWYRISHLLKFFSLITASLFIISGFLSNVHFLKHPGLSINPQGLDTVVSFLTKNGLNYGYGPYWGSRANAVTGLSQSQIIIRPVLFNKTSGQLIFGGRPESSKRWYQTNDAPVNQKNFFVVVRNDGEECPVVKVCVNGLNQQFGKPLKVLKFGDALILVWDHPLLNWSNKKLN